VQLHHFASYPMFEISGASQSPKAEAMLRANGSLMGFVFKAR
jgi:hypothetical protein